MRSINSSICYLLSLSLSPYLSPIFLSSFLSRTRFCSSLNSVAFSLCAVVQVSLATAKSQFLQMTHKEREREREPVGFILSLSLSVLIMCCLSSLNAFNESEAVAKFEATAHARGLLSSSLSRSLSVTLSQNSACALASSALRTVFVLHRVLHVAIF